MNDDLSDAPYRDPSRSVDERVADLLARMTLEEKAAQLTSVWLTVDPERGEVAPAQFAAMFGELADQMALLDLGVGQVTRPLGTVPVDPVVGATTVNDLQRRAVEGSRLGVPILFHEECLTGLMAQGATSFPSPLNYGATWDPDLIEQVGATIGRQMRMVGDRQGLGPVADVARDARWGRIEETMGEDPYLVGLMVSAYVRGLQGDRGAGGVVATLKHFVAYSFSEAGRNFAPTHVGPRELADVFMLPFEMAIKLGHADSVMNSYQEVDGEQPGSSHHLLTEVLRDRWGFDGFTVADYGAISFLHLFAGVAEGPVDAAALALRAGLDVELPAPAAYPTGIPAAIDRGLLTVDDVDRAVTRVLRAKFRLGLFEAPYVDTSAIALDTAADRALAGEVARRSITLLANDGVLPLDAATLGRVAVIGPNADEPMALFGNYSFENHLVSTHFADVSDVVSAPTVADVLRDRLGLDRVGYERGAEVMIDDRRGIDDAVALAAEADVAVVVVGDKAGHFKLGTVGEGTDTTDLTLPGSQAALVDAVLATGTPTVVVLLNGRPFALVDVADRAAAVVEAWFPGQDGAAAVVDVLLGEGEPGGRTTVSFSRGAGAQPTSYDHKPLSPGFPRQDDFGFVFPFGHGLTYTTFAYGGLEITPAEVDVSGTFTVRGTVTNTGARAGTEVVQLYLGDPVASVARPVLALRGFTRVALEAGEAAEVTFTVPTDLVAFTGLDLRRIVEPGVIRVHVGASSGDLRLGGEVTLVGEVREAGEDRALVSEVAVRRLGG